MMRGISGTQIGHTASRRWRVCPQVQRMGGLREFIGGAVLAGDRRRICEGSIGIEDEFDVSSATAHQASAVRMCSIGSLGATERQSGQFRA
jgi:hypothetical protein